MTDATYAPKTYRKQGGDIFVVANAGELQVEDSGLLEFGDAQDVSLKWDGTDLLILPVADDTGAIKFGNGTLDMDVRFTLGAAADYVELDVGAKALEVVGDVRLDLSGATIAAGNTDGGVVKAGTSGAPVTEDTANMKFMSFYFDDGATSGEAVGQYLRLYVTGAGGEGIAGRFFASVTDVAAGNARGLHASLSFAASGTVTGLGAAIEATLHLNSGGGAAGTLAALNAAINADGANSDPAGVTSLSVIRAVNQGNATGMADVDDDCALIDFAGWTVADGNMIATKAAGPAPNVTHSVRVRLPDGSLGYIYLGATALTA